MNSEFGALLPDATTRSGPRRRAHATRAQTLDMPGQFVAGASAAVSEEELRAQDAVAVFQKSLMTLAAAFHEDYGRDLDRQSRSGLERFVEKVPMRSLPAIGAESTGQLVATWRHDDDVLSIQFLERLRFNFALTVQGPNGPLRRWGEAYALTFFEEQPLAAMFTLS